MGNPKYRLAGSEGRPWCGKHPIRCLLCWCGYLRADVALEIEKAELVLFKAKPKATAPAPAAVAKPAPAVEANGQETLFQQALREGAQS